MTNPDTSVVIIGAGPSGLALAIELGMAGVDCVVVERNDRVGYAPRAKTTNVRTRTHLRRWGIADRLAAASPFGVDYPTDVAFVTKLGGPLVARFPNSFNCAPARDERYPEHGQWIPQYKLEQVLREQAETLPTVRLQFSTEFAGATQDEDDVSVTLRRINGGEEETLTARYLVGADGARSGVREAIGSGMSGTYGLSRNYNIVFRAPGLAQAHRHGPGSMYWQLNPAMPGLIGPMDADDIWFFMPTRLAKDTVITPDVAAAMIREATGIDLPYEILSSDEWVASSLIADRYRDRRLFLVGDACHLHPPFGGYGMNMGVADGVDLGWKLGAVLSGWGGPALLDSYEIERRPTHEAVMAEATANHSILSNDLWRDGIDADGAEGDRLRAEARERIVAAKEREFRTLGTVLGGCYRESPVIVGEDEGDVPTTPVDGRVYTPTSHPGCLAPHRWRADGSSLYDAFANKIALVCRPEAAAGDIERAVAQAGAVPLAVVHLTEEEAGELYPARLTLVRPDQFVAWRGDRWEDGLLDIVTGQREHAATAREAVRQDA
ncbi:FAD-dependent monooxygenase [Sphingomonas bacterium]|uniref:FAD-dependent monooxygenase n=1 Tax=Sphingomonas bacterium TaxID=1895847 RepID=UPI0015759C19|nr:FAD-dependent monooxygenase [Sphingomonas bacterium]